MDNTKAPDTTIDPETLTTVTGGEAQMTAAEAEGLRLSEARAQSGVRAAWDAIDIVRGGRR